MIITYFTIVTNTCFRFINDNKQVFLITLELFRFLSTNYSVLFKVYLALNLCETLNLAISTFQRLLIIKKKKEEVLFKFTIFWFVFVTFQDFQTTLT